MGVKARLERVERRVAVGTEVRLVWIAEGMTKEEAWRQRYGDTPMPAPRSKSTIMFLRWMTEVPENLSKTLP